MSGSDSSYHFVRVDSRRVECKAAALDAYMSIKESMQTTRHADTEEEQE